MTADGDLLTQAADYLDNVLAACSPGPWRRTGHGDFGPGVSATPDRWDPTDPHLSVETDDGDRGRADAAYIEAVNPIVGHALRDLLRVAVQSSAPSDYLLAAAREILAGRDAYPY
ncbi:hypothetical protein [Catenuloplanes indicus]|uniref:Uncharacterized protein n=1 Tax=Catenuloplanes indicus TaxID=137267 RepID=A0AAE3VTJ4_9ACTN|nr:hypothetical protein [Catenuloplanes indicus]MDQ0363387.1 hypothetical protein [Catenuloplanes indicus]